MVYIGCGMVVVGVLGIAISFADHREKGWNSTRMKFVICSWGMALIGGIMIATERFF